MYESLRIGEDVKREVLEYFTDRMEKEMVVDNFTISNIAKATGETEERLEEILSELEEEKLIAKYNISLGVYMPNVEKGRKFLKEIAARRAFSYSPYWLFLLSLAISWIAVPYLNLQMPAGIETTFTAYTQGIRNGIFLAAIVGIVGGGFLQHVSRKLIRWKWVSPQAYSQVVNVAKIAAGIVIVSWLVFFVMYQTYSFEVALAAATISLGALSAAITYVQIERKKGET